MRDKDNKTPLHYACFIGPGVHGRKDMVQYLVEEEKMDIGEIYCALDLFASA